MRKLLVTLTTLMLIIVLTACGGNDDKKITVGSKGFTEHYILGKIATILLEEHGFKVTEKQNLATSALRQALENKQVDLHWDYTSTGLVIYLDQDPIIDGKEAFDRINEIDPVENGITWTNLTELNNTYTILMRQADAEELNIKTISDLAAYLNENPGGLPMGTHAEFLNRPDGIPGVEETYGFEFTNDSIHEMDSGLVYAALRDNEIDASVGFATDARILDFDLISLEDDKQFFAAYSAALSMRTEILEQYPEIEEIFEPLETLLDDETAISLNYQVDIEKKSEDEVARNFLIENGLIEE